MTFYVEGLHAADDQVRRIGETESLDEAIAVAKRTIDEFLASEFKPGMPADELYCKYRNFGVVPCIFRDDGETMNIRGFDHLQYATARCIAICGGK